MTPFALDLCQQFVSPGRLEHRVVHHHFIFLNYSSLAALSHATTPILCHGALVAISLNLAHDSLMNLHD